MKLEIRNFYSADISNLPNWKPDDENEVFFHLEFEIAELGKKGANVFQVVVATPQGLSWFAQTFDAELPERAVLLLEQYSWDLLLDKLSSIVQTCTKDSWQDSIDQLRLYFMWEYEDLRSI